MDAILARTELEGTKGIDLYLSKSALQEAEPENDRNRDL